MLVDRRAVVMGLGLVALRPDRVLAAVEPVQAGSVLTMVGSSTRQQGRNKTKLAIGDTVFIDDTLGTGPSARLGVQLGEATKLSLGERTRVRIDKFLVDRGGELVLERGAILFDRPDDPPSGELDVATPFGLIAARGTRFFAGPSQGVFGVFVEHGLVTIRTRVGAVTLSDGLGTNLTSIRGAPSAPRRWGRARIEAALASVT